LGRYPIKSNEKINILDGDNIHGFIYFYMGHDNYSKIVEDDDGWVYKLDYSSKTNVKLQDLKNVFKTKPRWNTYY